MSENKAIESLRIKSIELLTEIYVQIRIDEKGEVCFHGDLTKEFVAKELGYNSSQITRFVKAFCDQRPKQKAYDRFIKRLEVHLEKKRLTEENEQLKKQIQHPSFLLNIERKSVLSNIQLHNLMQWHGSIVIHMLGVEALIFNMEVRGNNTAGIELEREISELRRRVYYIINQSRTEIRGIKLLAPNGDNVADLFAKIYSLESLESNFDRMIPYLTSKTIAPRELIKRTGDESRDEQRRVLEEIYVLMR